MTRDDGNKLKIVTAGGGEGGGGGSLSTRTRAPRGCITPSHSHTCLHTNIDYSVTLPQTCLCTIQHSFILYSLIH